MVGLSLRTVIFGQKWAKNGGYFGFIRYITAKYVTELLY